MNRDDPSAGIFEAVVRESGARLLTYGSDPSAAVHATRVVEDASRLRVRYAAPSGEADLELRLAGRFNVHNALAVVALGEAWELDPAAVRQGLESMPGVPGRMERVEAGQPFGVIVDYAHTPASLGGVLDLLAPLAAARGGGLIAVFGSAGERDTAKRPLMGRLAAERCRLVIVTDEDPRGEDREPSSTRSPAGPKVRARDATATSWSSPTGAPRSARPSSAPSPATSSSSPARVTSTRSSVPTDPRPGTSAPPPWPPSPIAATEGADRCAAFSPGSSCCWPSSWSRPGSSRRSWPPASCRRASARPGSRARQEGHRAADPPIELLTLRADKVHLEATDARFAGLRSPRSTSPSGRRPSPAGTPTRSRAR